MCQELTGSSDSGRTRLHGASFKALSQAVGPMQATGRCYPTVQLIHHVLEWFVRQPRWRSDCLTSANSHTIAKRQEPLVSGSPVNVDPCSSGSDRRRVCRRLSRVDVHESTGCGSGFRSFVWPAISLGFRTFRLIAAI
jgi:hypothetical protein